MPDTVIRVENLSKRYTLDHQAAGGGRFRYERFSDKLIAAAKAPLRFLRNRKPEISDPDSQPSKEEFWALRDVSFEIKQGDAVGIIGRNGAGKSTLLKILSRITEPTAGRIELNGRVASLLEVGTGFHPELTGRENVYLNGAILGMSRVEIRKKFDEIVAFAEVEKFLDTPVKRYSSGMYVRLAFAVAAYLEPEILIVDEVLAVGDAQFQKKCLGKMNDSSKKEGRTVLFVSHNMTAIQNLCTKAILLHSGLIEATGTPNQCVAAYLTEATKNDRGAEIDLTNINTQRNGDKRAFFTRLRLLRTDKTPADSFPIGTPFYIELTVDAADYLGDFVLGFAVSTKEQTVIFCSNHYDSLERQSLPVGRHIFCCLVKDLFLSPGSYTINIAINSGDLKSTHDFIYDAAELIIQEIASEDLELEYLVDPRPGLIRKPLEWKLEHV